MISPIKAIKIAVTFFLHFFKQFYFITSRHWNRYTQRKFCPGNTEYFGSFSSTAHDHSPDERNSRTTKRSSCL